MVFIFRQITIFVASIVSFLMFVSVIYYDTYIAVRPLAQTIKLKKFIFCFLLHFIFLQCRVKLENITTKTKREDKTQEERLSILQVLLQFITQDRSRKCLILIIKSYVHETEPKKRYLSNYVDGSNSSKWKNVLVVPLMMIKIWLQNLYGSFLTCSFVCSTIKNVGKIRGSPEVYPQDFHYCYWKAYSLNCILNIGKIISFAL